MEPRTVAYLRGRFRDHYRRSDLTLPPDAERREWGYIPWTEGPGTTMIRHRSLLELGELETFLERERPQHVYFSAGRYEDPGAGSMGEKGWLGSDLIFDLDADHLPEVDPGADTYAEMLATCKDALLRLLDFLEDDFAFEDLEVAFSGGRGYHVHVRDDRVQELEREHRREIVDYVRGIGVEPEALVRREAVGGEVGRETPAERRRLSRIGGWSARALDRIEERIDELLAMDEESAIAALSAYEGIGERRARAALTAAESNRDAIASGNVNVHPAFYQVTKRLLEEAVERGQAPIDEPVTTDTNRLIRLPGSLHGGSALSTRRIPRDDLADFDPLVDAVPETFRGHDIAVDVSDPGTIELGGDTFTLDAGPQSLPEHVAMFLMARGRAEKETE